MNLGFYIFGFRISQIGFGIYRLLATEHTQKYSLLYRHHWKFATHHHFCVCRVGCSPFSPEQVPINEMESMVLLTLIIEIILIILMAYLLIYKSITKEKVSQIQLTYFRNSLSILTFFYDQN